MVQLHSSLVFSSVDKCLSILITIAMTAIVARVLSPDEIGVYVVANSVLVMSEALRDFGTSSYIIQENVPTRAGVRTVFTVMTCIGAALALVLILSAPMLATFYEEARLTVAIRLATLGIFVSSLSAALLSVLRREMDFKILALINVGGVLVNFLVTVGLAFAGWSYLALIVGGVSYQLFAAAAAMIYRPHFWVFVPSLSKWREVLAFGGWSSATSLLNNFYSMLPQLLLGRMAGLDAAALYNRATILCQLPERAVIGAVYPVVLPALSAKVRTGDDIRSAYLNSLGLLSAIHWPLLLGLAILAEPAVRIVLGPQWDAAAPVVRIMAVAWLTVAVAAMTFPVLVAIGRIRDTLIASLISLPPSAVILVLAAPHGMTMVAAAVLVTLPLQVVVAMLMVRRHIHFTWTEVAVAMWKSAVAGCASAAVPFVVAWHNGFQPAMPYHMIFLALVGACAGWVAMLAATGHPLLAALRATSGHITRFGHSPAVSRTLS
jgi:O-antigen/teichoic acid export membrane protein